MDSESKLFNTLLSFVAVSAVSVCLLGAGAMIATQRGWGQRNVQVAITNHAGQPIKVLRLQYKGSAQTGQIEWRQSLSNGETTTLRFDVAGEASYTLEAVLANRTRVTGGAGYVEPGYRTQEEILPKSIRSQTQITWF